LQSKIAKKIPTNLYFARVPLEIGYRHWGSETQNNAATRPTKKTTQYIQAVMKVVMFDDIFSRVDTMHQRVRRTDGQMDSGRRHRPRLHIALRGKNE